MIVERIAHETRVPIGVIFFQEFAGALLGKPSRRYIIGEAMKDEN
jgi:hypothetical protein